MTPLVILLRLCVAAGSLLAAIWWWLLRQLEPIKRLERFYADPAVPILTKVMIGLWSASSVATFVLAPWLAFREQWALVYLVTPNEAALVVLVLHHPVIFIYTFGWLRKLGFKPWIYDAGDYLLDPLSHEQVYGSIRWYRPRFIARMALNAETSRHPAKLMFVVVTMSPSNLWVVLAARLRVGKLLVMSAVVLGSFIRITLAVLATQWLDTFVGITEQSKYWLAGVFAGAFVYHGIMTILRAALSRS